MLRGRVYFGEPTVKSVKEWASNLNRAERPSLEPELKSLLFISADHLTLY